MPRGKRLNSTVKKVIVNVYDYFDKESKKRRRAESPKLGQKTADATGYCRRSVERVVGEKRSLEGAEFPSPSKRYKQSRERVIVDDFDVEAIRRTIHGFYGKKEFPTLDKILTEVRRRGLFTAGRTSLWKLLRKIGFKYKKINDKRYVYEQPKIVYQRHQFLRRMRRNRRENVPKSVIYLDETWTNSHSSREQSWVEADDKILGGTKGGLRRPSGKGTRLIILHAGGEDGWVDGADLVFQSKKATGDYHDEMNSMNFEEWFHDKLMPNIPRNSIVMNNASYHSRYVERVPSTSTRKADMQDWLTRHGIEFPERALKRELLSLVRLSNIKPKYVIDEMAKASGHEVVRIPPYHCELNPIELCWSQVKGYIKEHNTDFKLSSVKQLTYDGFKKVGPAEWKRNVKHVKSKAEEFYWIADCLQDDLEIPEFVINVDEDDTTDEEVEDTDGSIEDDESNEDSDD